jgi:gamma-glutamyl-gamma-aminobutyrate hydrolase PuuD
VKNDDKKRKPIIGVVSKNITIDEFYNWSWQRISNDVRYSINKNGGLVLGILPQTTRKEFNRNDESENIKMSEGEIFDLLSMVDKCDGIVLQGGISSHNYEEYIAKYCYDNNIPLLGICAGYNNIIRGLGGKATRIDNVDVHDRPDLMYAHKCRVIDKESLFYNCVKEDVLSVNSVHTYVGTVIPEELSIIALSDDKQVEVVEAKGKKFFMGVKYHPELLVDIDDKQNNIFKTFLNICRSNIE